MGLIDIRMIEVNELVKTVLSGLSPLVIRDVLDAGERIVMRAQTRPDTEGYPACGAPSERVHGYHWRTVADLPIDGRRVVVRVRVRRLVSHARLQSHLPRTSARRPGPVPASYHPPDQASQCHGQGVSGRPLAILAVSLSRHTALRALLRIPLPTGRVPRVINVDDFALRRRHTVIVDLPRPFGALCPGAVQVGDRWHVWKNLCEAALSKVKAHSTCWATVLDAPLYNGPRAQTTLERWHPIDGLLDQGVGLLECVPRLQLALTPSKGTLVPTA